MIDQSSRSRSHQTNGLEETLMIEDEMFETRVDMKINALLVCSKLSRLTKLLE